ncbi:MAG: endonuclease [Ferruginibacter sp.]
MTMIQKLPVLILILFLGLTVNAQINITVLNSPYTQDFNTLANAGTSSVVPTGWAFSESGGNTLYTAGTGSSGTGDTYSFGTTAADRAFGGLLSGSLNPTIGASFKNNTGSTITSITINYTGEQWRLGATARVDRIDFQYSTDATSLSSGTWIDDNNLDFIAPVTAGTIGALNGNTAANRTVIPAITINALSINPGAEFWIRWADLNASGADDGLGIDDFTINVDGIVIPACTEPANQPTNLILSPTPTTINGTFDAAIPVVDEYLVVRSLSNSLSAGPVDGTSYLPGDPIGGGNVVVSTTTTSFTDINLTPSTLYYYYVFAHNNENCSSAPNYQQLNPLANNSTTASLPPCTNPPLPPTNLNLTASNTVIIGSFTAAAGANKYLSVISTSSTLSATPVDGTTYTAGQAFGGGNIINYTASTSFSVTGLTVSTNYYIFIFSVNAECTGEPFYNTNSLNGNTTTTNDPSGIPAGYYNAAAGLNCDQLKTALFNIISANYIQLTYGEVWTAYATTDMHRNDANTADIIWDMYSDNPAGAEPYTYTYGSNQCGNYNSEADCYNREHSFPKSWFNDGYPMYTDINHLFPTDGYVNGRRGNQPYGEVSSPTWTSLNGAKLGPNTYPGFSGVVFEPRNEYKGDLARGQLYMVTRYQNLVSGWVGYGNANDVLSGNAYPSFDNWYIKMLFKWHANDPVSAKEISRNNAVYSIQANRNPFIDHPEYVYKVWQCTGLLPVTIIDFTAQKNNESVLLKWYATFEANFKKYEIERSTNGSGFYKIGEVEGRNLADYSFTDNNLPNANTVYYRLKMIDIDGQFSNSKTVVIKISNNFSNALVYPNPTKEKLTVKLQQPLTANSRLIITDLSGRIVWQQQVTGGQKIIDLELGSFAVGRYFIKISNHNELINQSFVIIK